MRTYPSWLETVVPVSYPPLDTDLRADVLVVGAGITGLTAAYLLGRAKYSVVVVDRQRLGRGETGHTTAHVTYVTDTRLLELEKRFGRDHAQATWDAGAHAMAQIRKISQEEEIACELTSLPGYLVAAQGTDAAKQGAELEREAKLAEELGFDALFVHEAPVLPRPAMRVANQFKFQPVRYLAGLAQRIVDLGGQIFEETELSEFEEKPLRAKANGYTIECDRVILATHVPLQGLRNTLNATLLQSKLSAYSSYVLGAKIRKGLLPEILWWDTADPYLYLRVDRRAEYDYVILGGADHKTGQEVDTEMPYRRVRDALEFLVPEAIPDHRWSARVIESVDGLPYIGAVGENQFLATGYGGNGMTFGTLAGMMACDFVRGVKNPWQDLFSPERKKLSATWDYVNENKDYAYYLFKDRLMAGEKISVEELKPGEGKVLRLKGGKVAAYRNIKGELHLCSAVCPHMGCIVHWNDAQRTWDCPCHGSRFHADGKLLAGPAESGLTPHDAAAVEVTEEVSR